MAILFERRPFWHFGYCGNPSDGPARQLNLGPITVVWMRGSFLDLVGQARAAGEAEAFELGRRHAQAETIGAGREAR
jgi:hypothetical protein